MQVRKFLPIIIGVLLSIPLAIGAFFLTQGAMTRASVTAPTDVRAIDITDSKATISWITDGESQGVIEYGTSPDTLNTYAPEITPKTSHKVTLTLLQPNRSYYYQIRIGDETFNNEGVPWTFKTKLEGSVQGVADMVSPSPKKKSSKIKPSTESVSDPIPTTKVVDKTIMRLPTAHATYVLGQPTSGAAGRPVNCPQTTDCDLIQEKLGKGCTSTEYVQCLKQNNGEVQGSSTQKKSSKLKATSTPKPTLALPQTVE